MVNQKYDAVIVPGGGVLDSVTPTPWTEKRLDRALEIAGDCFIIALSAGTPHKPPVIDNNGFPVFESLVSARYLMRQGFESHKILIEHHSYDTIGNAFFARTIHTDPRRFSKLVVITSRFHMERMKKIFDWVFNLPPRSVEYSLEYIATEDAGMSKESLESRITGEKRRVASLEKVIESVNSLSSLHCWLFEHHDVYAVGRLPEVTDEDEIHTY